MPLKRCTTENGASGWKYGDSGKCYRSKKDAIKQMVAIKMNGGAELIKDINNTLQGIADDITEDGEIRNLARAELSPKSLVQKALEHLEGKSNE